MILVEKVNKTYGYLDYDTDDIVITNKPIIRDDLVTYNKNIQGCNKLNVFYKFIPFELLAIRLGYYLKEFNNDEDLCRDRLQALKLIYKNSLKHIEKNKVLSVRYNKDFTYTKPSDIICSLLKPKPFNKKSFYLDLETGFYSGKIQKLYKDIVDYPFVVADKITHDFLPQELYLDDLQVNVVFGGIHSINKTTTYDNCIVTEIDVFSYYSSLLLTNKKLLSLQQKDFNQLLSSVYNDRKNCTDSTTKNALKIILNSCTGRLNEKNSVIYNPQMYIQMTVVGQLYILKLIDLLRCSGIKVIACNTDSVTVINTDNELLKQVVDKWKFITKLNVEFTDYKFYHLDSVNDYIAIKNDGTIKCKGLYNIERNENKNTNALVCYKCLVAKLFNEDLDIQDYICNYNDKQDFLFYGTSKNTVYRMYRTVDKYQRNCYLKLNNRKIPNSDNCDFVHDEWEKSIDYNWYIYKTYELYLNLKNKT